MFVFCLQVSLIPNCDKIMGQRKQIFVKLHMYKKSLNAVEKLRECYQWRPFSIPWVAIMGNFHSVNGLLIMDTSARPGFGICKPWVLVLKREWVQDKYLFKVGPPFEKPGPSAHFEKVKGRHYLKEILILRSFFFEDKDPRDLQAKNRSCTKVTK